MRIANIFKGDSYIWLIFFFLCMISIVEVFSASSGLTYGDNNYIGPIAKHIATICLGVIIMLVVTNIQCRFFKVMMLPALAFSFVTLILVLFFGEDINGANRTLFGFQPSEVAKGSLILGVAQVLSLCQTDSGTDPLAFKLIMFVTVIFCLLIGNENLSTAVLLFGVVYIMMIIGRVSCRNLFWVAGICAGIVSAALAFVLIVGGDVDKNPQLTQLEQTSEVKKESKFLRRATTWKGRILKFANREKVPPNKFDLDKDGQVGHANIAIVSSNFCGVGPGNSVERDFLSQAFSDFIYAIVIEELGIGGAIFVALLYVTLLFRTLAIANRCENSFPAFLIMGFALLLAVQAVSNMFVAVGIFPVTGQPLPLISKGGSSTIMSCIYIGAILSVSRTAKKKDKAKKGKNNAAPEMAMAKA